MKSDKIPYIIFADLEFLIKKIDGCGNNPEKSSATNKGVHVPCRYSMSAIWIFDNIEYKHTLHGVEDCIKETCTSLREHPTNLFLI